MTSALRRAIAGPASRPLPATPLIERNCDIWERCAWRHARQHLRYSSDNDTSNTNIALNIELESMAWYHMTLMFVLLRCGGPCAQRSHRELANHVIHHVNGLSHADTPVASRKQEAPRTVSTEYRGGSRLNTPTCEASALEVPLWPTSTTCPYTASLVAKNIHNDRVTKP